MKRIYHHYEKWEDFQDGMWRILSKDEEREMLPRAVEFTGDADLYGSFMMRVIVEWPVACEQNLSNEGINRLAWVGHAATSLAIHCPEYVTRQAWGLLTQRQRDEANSKAQLAVDTWVHQHRFGGNQYAFQY